MSRPAVPTRRRFCTLAVLLALSVGGCAAFPTPDAPPPQPDRQVLQLEFFKNLPGWKGDLVTEAIPPLLRSCEKIAAMDPEKPLDSAGIGGKAKDWVPICAAAKMLRPGDDPQARYFFETHFEPFQILNNDRHRGLVTGYYEPELRGAWQPDPTYRVPIYSRPPDLVSVDLGKFRDDLKGQHIAGTVKNDHLIPFATRREIESGALKGRSLELLWVDDPADAFFLHVQGSGRVRMKEGGFVRLAYSGRNGHRYVPIGRELVAAGVMPLDKVTMQSIRAWLDRNPIAGRDLMARNHSFVFFRVLDGDGPVGAQGTVLTPGRSIAVDRKYLPLGLPVWLDTVDPLKDGQPLQRLTIAQDTGSAIVGPVRADFFFGSGDTPAIQAGAMKRQGRMYVLRPVKRSR